MGVIKDIIRVLNENVWDDHYPRTSSDNVIHTKSDGTATTVQEELLAQNSTLTVLNAKKGAAGSALRFLNPSDNNYTNLTYGYWGTGLYTYPGYFDGAPDNWAGVLFVFESAGIFIKYAFSNGGTIYFMRQSADGTISQAWQAIGS